MAGGLKGRVGGRWGERTPYCFDYSGEHVGWCWLGTVSGCGYWGLVV